MIVFVCDGDIVMVDVEVNWIDMDVSDDEFVVCCVVWEVFFYKVCWGIFYKYIKMVKLVFEGCVIDE